MATNDGALVEINPVTDKVQSYSLNTDANAPQLQIRQLIYDEDKVWVASSKGVFKFDINTKKFNLVETTADFEINTFAKEKNGILWLGTMQNGLKKLAIKDDVITTPDASNLPYTCLLYTSPSPRD